MHDGALSSSTTIIIDATGSNTTYVVEDVVSSTCARPNSITDSELIHDQRSVVQGVSSY